MDFTVKLYKKLLSSLINKNFNFITFSDYIENYNFSTDERIAILRQDVDDKPINSLNFAKIQASLGIRSTYYFRIVPQSFDTMIIKEIYQLGHEIGYHYEDMDFAKGDRKKAIIFFEKHLKQLQEIAPVKTICMHGSPKSNFDNKEVWKDYEYRKFGIIGEPYFDIDFNSFFYITDTGRMWDGYKVSIRDKIKTPHNWSEYHSTSDIIKAIEEESFPKKVMMNFHPQRWNDKPLPWLKELIWQNIKNQGKRLILTLRK